VIVAILLKLFEQDLESVMVRLYVPAANALISSDVEVYPDGPVQLKLYDGEPPEAVIFTEPVASLKQFNVSADVPSTLAAISEGCVIVAILGRF